MSQRVKNVGILTSGGDCPGLNAVIRAVAKSLLPEGVRIYGFLEGFNGLVNNNYIELNDERVSGLLTVGGTILRTSRSKPHKMPDGKGGTVDRTEDARRTYESLNLDCLVCLGGGGTMKNAYQLQTRAGMNVIGLPKTIDNDVWGTDISFGFDTGMAIATEALDRLHTTASSHHRVMVVDIMGHNAGWLALGAGIAGGADVILIPEIKYDLEIVAKSLLARMARGKMFSLVAVAEGAWGIFAKQLQRETDEKKNGNGEKKGSNGDKKNGNGDKKNGDKKTSVPAHSKEPLSALLAESLEEATGLETRVTSLGYIQRGGVPTPTDRLLCTKYGTQAAELVLGGSYGYMVAKRGLEYVPIPLEEVVGKRRTVPPDHPWVRAARAVGTCMGDEMPHGYK